MLAPAWYNMENLNKLEISILERLSERYASIKMHIPYLQILNRENTGVGMYINFGYSKAPIGNLNIPDSSISTNENIDIKGLKYGLGYEVDISNGKINFIELFTYGEEWDGIITEYNFKN